jgi:hypothetical protein
MSSKKYTYRVKSGQRFGAFQQYGPGMTISMTEEEATDFLDIVELVKEKEIAEDVPDEASHLAKLTVGQLKNLPEYELLENPKPKGREAILQAILEAKGLAEKDGE